MRGDANREVLEVRFRVFDHDVEVAIVVEDAGVDELVLGAGTVARAVAVDQLLVRKCALRILVEQAHVRVRRRVVDVKVVLLDVFAVVALRRVHAEEALFQMRVGLVPERRREAQHLITIGDAGDAVFAPAIRFRARFVVREVAPRVAVGAVVLAHGAPRAIG